MLSYEAMHSNSVNTGGGENFITNCVSHLAAQIPWLYIPQNHGDTHAGTDSTPYLHIDTNRLSEGVYTGNIQVISNDPDSESIQVPITLNVLPVFPQADYDSWVNDNLSGETVNIGFSEDFDNDNLSNGEEFYFSTNPKAHNSRKNLPAIKMSNAGPLLSYTRKTGLSDNMLIWESCDDLAQWGAQDMSNVSSGIATTKTDNGDGTTTVTLLLDNTNQTSQFFRYKLWSETTTTP